MKRKLLINIHSILVFLLFYSTICYSQNTDLVSIKSHSFFLKGKPLYFIGTNYWYGGLLAAGSKDSAGLHRLTTELDFLKNNGVNNLRILAGAEGSGLVSGVERVGPALQRAPGVFDTALLSGLDVLLSEMGKREMKAVIFFSNNWEWSGGFLQYLRWNDEIADSVFRRKLSWDETRDYVSRFYKCEPCKSTYLKQVDLLLNRINRITGTKYINDPAIMAWELANEPRPMRPSAIHAYKNWISKTAEHIKQTDPNHLITIGTEGYIGTEDLEVYEAIHADKNIDYLTIHIWPKNWEWFHGNDMTNEMDSVIGKTMSYLDQHISIAEKLQKPLVIEEFGLPRHMHSFELTSSTIQRDRYYGQIFQRLERSKKRNGKLMGANFWSYGGDIQPAHIKWQKGDRYIGDPPMEEQGLNAVFNTDTGTWNIIKKSAALLK